MIQFSDDRMSPCNTNFTIQHKQTDIKLKKRIKIRKILKNDEIQFTKEGFKIGKWHKEEHHLFLQACEKHGNNWTKIQEELKTRSAAQIRSHAQKFIIKLCKKYQIKLKSKKFKKKSPKHLESINKPKLLHTTVNNQEFDSLEKKLLDTFNYYNREYKPFVIEKVHKSHASHDCILDVTNKKTEFRLKNQIFMIKKFTKKNANTHDDKWNDILTEKEKNSNELEEFLKLEMLQKIIDLRNFNDIFYHNLTSNNYDLTPNHNIVSFLFDNFFIQNNNIGNHFYRYNYFQELKKNIDVLFSDFNYKKQIYEKFIFTQNANQQIFNNIQNYSSPYKNQFCKY